MFARLVSAQVSSNNINEGIKIWKEKDIPPDGLGKGIPHVGL